MQGSWASRQTGGVASSLDSTTKLATGILCFSWSLLLLGWVRTSVFLHMHTQITGHMLSAPSGITMNLQWLFSPQLKKTASSLSFP